MASDSQRGDAGTDGTALQPLRVAAILAVSGDEAALAPGPIEVLAAAEAQPFALAQVVVVADRHVWDAQFASVSRESAVPVRNVSPEGAANFGQAVAAAFRQFPELADYDWIWLLHDDSVPDPQALGEMLAATSGSRTVAMVGPKQVLYSDPERLLEVGIEATATARRVYRLEPGEIDQGQHDRREDVLAVGTAGSLIRPKVLLEVGGFDPALGPFGDGLELGRRLWLAGYRVVVAPRAVVRHARRSYGDATQGATSFARRRSAQLYNWFLAAPLWQLPILAVFLPLWTLLRSVGRLFSRTPSLFLSEWAAYLQFVGKTPALFRARRRLRRTSRTPRSALRTLESPPSLISQTRRANRRIAARGTEKDLALDDAALRALHRHRLNVAVLFWSLLVLTLGLSVLTWYPYAHGLQGGSWGALPSSWRELAAQAWSGWQVSGDGAPGPAAPILGVFAALSAPFALAGISPSDFSVIWVFITAPLAFWGGWGIASSFTRSPWIRGAGAVLWAGSATLLVGLAQGELALSLVYVFVPAVATGVFRFALNPVSMRAEGVEDIVATAHPARWSWLGLAALASIPVVASAPLAVVVLPAFGYLVVRFARRSRSWRVWAAGLLAVPGLAWILPSLWAEVGGTWATFGSWLSGPATSGSPFSAFLGVSASGIASWSVALGSLPGAVLTVWACLSAVGAVRRERALSLAGGLWLGGVALVLLFTLQVVAWPGEGSGSGFLLAAAGAAWLAAVASSYSNYRVLAKTLLLPGDPALRAERKSKLRQGLPSATAVAAGLASLVGLLVLGPVGVLSHGTDEVEGMGGAGFVAPSSSPVIPLIASEAQAGVRKARLLTLRVEDDVVTAQLLRSRGLQLADITGASDSGSQQEVSEVASFSLAEAIATLTSATSTESAPALQAHAVDLVQLADDSEQVEEIREVLDATPGLQKIGAVAGAELWRVRVDGQAPARVTVVSEDGAVEVIESGYVSVSTELPEDQDGGVLVLAEVADPYWHASLDGQPLESTDDPSGDQGWRQAFALPAGGGDLTITYRPPYLAPWLAVGAVLTLGVLVLAVPRGVRRQSLEPREVAERE